ncbi:MAG: twin-arginine translocase subunit TatC [Chloroflexota bacterium]
MTTQLKSLPPETSDDGHELRMSLMDHLNELRGRITKAAIMVVIGTAIGAIFAGNVFEFLLAPYGRQVQVLDPTGSVTNYFRVALMIGGIIAIPVVTYQLMMFILPGLTNKERRIVLTSLPAITILFVIGVAFSWFLLIPPALDFLANFQSQIFLVEWTADGYLGFVTSLVFWMGVAFETPLVFFVTAVLGFVTAPLLIKNWRIAIIGAAVAAAMITPTIDPVNMFLVMAPLLMLYLLSILLVVIGTRMNQPKPE